MKKLLKLLLVLAMFTPAYVQAETKPKAEETLTSSNETLHLEESITEEEFLETSTSFYVNASATTGTTGLLKTQLTSDELEIYNAIAATNISASNNEAVLVKEYSSMDEIYEMYNTYYNVYSRAMYAYMYDHQEQFFWNSVNGISLSVGAYGSQAMFIFSYIVSSYYTATIGQQAANEMSIAEAYVNNNSTDTYTKVKAIHDWVVLNNTYDYSALSASQDSEVFYYAHSALGCLINHTGVCESYAKTFKSLCNYYSIPCLYVCSSNHAFNYVKLDGQWYLVDCTFDDDDAAKIDYSYFLIPSDMDSDANHKPTKEFSYPDTATTKYVYTPSTPTYTDINTLSLTTIGTEFVYDGYEWEPEIESSDVSSFVKGTDYTVTYSNNINVGVASAVVTGIGKYCGTQTLTFTIVPGEAEITSVTSGDKCLTVKAASVASNLDADGYEIAYKKIEDTQWTTVRSTTSSKKISGLTYGEQYYVKIRTYKVIDGVTYYGSWNSLQTSDAVLCTSHTYTNTITKATLTKDGSITKVCSICGHEETATIARPNSFKLSYTTCVYNGSIKNPSLTITDTDGNVIASSNYTVTKDEGRIEAGIYYYTVTFKGNKYSGTKKVKFIINPAQAVIKNIGVGENTLTVKASTTPAALSGDGFEVIYRPVGTTTWTHITSTTTTIRLTELPTGTQYQVRMRAYKVINGTKYYGAWSTINYTPKVR